MNRPINESDRIELLLSTLNNLEVSQDQKDLFDSIKYNINCLIDNSNSLKEYVIRISDNINSEYFSYPIMVNKINNRENFTMVRYQDGEWTCMLKVEPHFTNKIPKYGIEIDKLGDKLLSIINKKPKYYISVNAGTLIERSSIVWSYIKDIKNLFVGEILRRVSVEGGIESFIESLRNRRVIVVGPNWLTKLKIYFEFDHIVTPMGTLFKEDVISEIETSTKNKIEVYIDECPVILYSCSFVAKLLCDKFYDEYVDLITQIDIGAIWDPYCDKKTRPYHDKVLNRLNQNKNT